MCFTVRSGHAGVSKELSEAQSGKVESSFRDLGSLIVAKQIGDKVEARSHFFEGNTFLEIILIAALAPTRQVGTADSEAVLAEFGDDSVVRDAIIEHGIDGITQVLREPGDVAVAAAGVWLLLRITSWTDVICNVHGFEVF